MSHRNAGDWHAALLAVWRPLETRLDDLDRALWQRATDTSGLGPMRNVWSNAMIALADGHPWRDVDYDALRLAIRVDEILRKRVRVLRRNLWRTLYDRYRADRPVVPWGDSWERGRIAPESDWIGALG